MKKFETGFTLVEVVIAALIIVVITGSIMYGVITTDNSLRNVELRHRAFNTLANKMEEFKAALLAFQQVKDLYYDTDFIEMAHLKTIACYIERNELNEAKIYYSNNRSFIEKIQMDDLVDAWFVQNRVFDRIELE